MLAGHPGRRNLKRERGEGRRPTLPFGGCPPRLRVLMLRCFGVAPKGPKQESPGQRPGYRHPDILVALKGRHKAIALFRPFRARSRLVGAIPGRCPGLICGCPFGAEGKNAQHQNLRVGLVWPVVSFSSWRIFCTLQSAMSHQRRR
jgi:hypothetical protein